MVSLSAAPSAMAVDAGADRTVLVYSGSPVVDVLEHEYFDVETTTLDEPMTDILDGNGYALLYNDVSWQSGKDVYRLDLGTGDLLEYRVQNPLVSLHLAPTEEFAIALTRAENGGGDAYDQRPGMEILDLRDTGRARTYPYMLESPAVGMAFSSSDQALYAIVLQAEMDYLYQLDLYTGLATQVDLDEPPVAIGSMPGGGFFIAHDQGLGMVSFYDPVTNGISEVAGFATLGIMDEIRITKDEEVE
jgi:hypothetical protein